MKLLALVTPLVLFPPNALLLIIDSVFFIGPVLLASVETTRLAGRLTTFTTFSLIPLLGFVFYHRHTTFLHVVFVLGHVST